MALKPSIVHKKDKSLNAPNDEALRRKLVRALQSPGIIGRALRALIQEIQPGTPEEKDWEILLALSVADKESRREGGAP